MTKPFKPSKITTRDGKPVVFPPTWGVLRTPSESRTTAAPVKVQRPRPSKTTPIKPQKMWGLVYGGVLIRVRFSREAAVSDRRSSWKNEGLELIPLRVTACPSPKPKRKKARK